MNPLIDALTENVWPLSFILVALLALRQFREDVRPIFLSMRDGLQVQAQKNSSKWALGCLVGANGGAGALVQVATEMHWPMVKAFAFVGGAMVAAVMGWLVVSPMQKPNGNGGTTPPIP